MWVLYLFSIRHVHEYKAEDIKKKRLKKKKATNISKKEADNNEKVAWTEKKILTLNN